MTNFSFPIIWEGTPHPSLEAELIQFCNEQTHPRNMFILHLPVGDDGCFIDASWDEARGALIARFETDPDERMTISADDDDDFDVMGLFRETLH